MNFKKKIFIGCSSEGLDVAESIQILLSQSGYEVILWNQGVFGLSRGILEELLRLFDQSDFGIFILRSDDLTTSRDIQKGSTRDNVIFELGLSFGTLGRQNTFVLYDKAEPPKIMSDLSGVIFETYDGNNEDLNIALGPAVSRIKQELKKCLTPDELLYTEWHLDSTIYRENLYLYITDSRLSGLREYEEVGGGIQYFNVNGYVGRGFYWLEYHKNDGTGGGTIMLHDIGTGNFEGFITAGHCDTSRLRCYKNRWVMTSDEQRVYQKSWLQKIGEY